MKLFRFLLLLSLFTTPAVFGAKQNDDINAYFAPLNTNQKRLFIKNMPKGGELHFHLSGSLTPEKMLTLPGNYCLQPNFVIAKTNHCNYISTSHLPLQETLYKRVIRDWSLKDFHPSKDHTAADHFFASFLKFTPMVNDHRPEMIAALMTQAANQNTHYLEMIISPDNNQSVKFSPLIKSSHSLEQSLATLTKNKQVNEHSLRSIHYADTLLKKAKTLLKCPGPKACDVQVAFQYYVLREQPFNAVSTQAISAFMAAEKSSSIVGVNLVQAEDGYLSLRDYKKQMQLFGFLHHHFPNVNISLHAGELAPQAVPPQALRFHISDAVHLANAKRIGHGADIAHEDNTEQLLNYMAKNNIAVEINLTSNEKLLGLKGEQHPLKLYLSYGVPVVLSTDDEGLLRTNLVEEYLKAAVEHNLSYNELKQISRNALSYSFLPGKSLWKKQGNTMVKPCAKSLDYKATPDCQAFLDNNQKAAAQWQLEQRFYAFEASPPIVK